MFLPFLLSILAFNTSDSLMRPGVSRELAAYRAERISDVRYDLSLDVSKGDLASGRVTVRFEWRGAGDLVIDFRGPGLDTARSTVNGRRVRGLSWNGSHLRIPEAALIAGANRVDLAFAAAIAPAGASIIRYRDVTDGGEYLYTLLVPADANQLFPCFDQPDLKARITLTLTTPRGWTAVANGARTSMDSTTSAAVLVHRFAESAPISTYLISFAAGPWATVTDTTHGRPITAYVRRSRLREADLDTLVAINARALDWLERYFARPYPFGKYDFVLAPAFPFGGMEHPGAVFYNEDRFIFRERPTLPQRLGREATIYHEVAHQWFGDLVTMRWFDDLWLKEGFATYMAAKMQASLDSSSGAWKTFYLRNKAVAYGTDATAGTTPVWQTLANLDQAKSAYGPIVYNKAPSVLKQLDHLVGEEAFRVGVQRFLERHAYSNATWRDLLSAIGEASGRSLDAWGAQYIMRPGMPVLEQSRTARGDTLRIVQRPAHALSGAGSWPIRLSVLTARTGAAPSRQPVEITAETTLVAIDARAELVYANADDYGYALLLLDDGSVRWLERRVGTIDDAFLRAMLFGSLWDLVREARLDPARFIALALRELPRESDEQILSALLGRVARATTVYLSAAARDSLGPRLERTLRAMTDDTSRAYGMRKSALDALISVARTPTALAHLDSLLGADSVAGDALRSPTRWSIVTALVASGRSTAERRLAAEARRDSTSDGRRRAFVAGAARPTAAVKRQYFRRWFADSALNEDWVTASLGAFNVPAHDALTRAHLVAALDTLGWIQRNRRIFFLGSWLSAFMDGQRSPEALEMVERWLAAHPRLAPDLRQKVLQSADELRRTVAIRRAWGAGTGRIQSRAPASSS